MKALGSYLRRSRLFHITLVLVVVGGFALSVGTADAAERSVTLNFDRGLWRATGIQVQQGKRYQITAAALNDGIRCHTQMVRDLTRGDTTLTKSGTPFSAYHPCTLIGRVDNGRLFYVGNGTTFTAHRDGNLVIGINDYPDDEGNNGGDVRVDVRGEFPPSTTARPSTGPPQKPNPPLAPPSDDEIPGTSGAPPTVSGSADDLVDHCVGLGKTCWILREAMATCIWEDRPKGRAWWCHGQVGRASLPERELEKRLDMSGCGKDAPIPPLSRRFVRNPVRWRKGQQLRPGLVFYCGDPPNAGAYYEGFPGGISQGLLSRRRRLWCERPYHSTNKKWASKRECVPYTNQIAEAQAARVQAQAKERQQQRAKAGAAARAADADHLTGDRDPGEGQLKGCYRSFHPTRQKQVILTACEREGGGSGFYRLENRTDQPLDVCWRLHYRDGTTTKRECHSGLKPGQNASSSCYSCSRKNTGGVVRVTWEKVQGTRSSGGAKNSPRLQTPNQKGGSHNRQQPAASAPPPGTRVIKQCTHQPILATCLKLARRCRATNNRGRDVKHLCSQVPKRTFEEVDRQVAASKSPPPQDDDDTSGGSGSGGTAAAGGTAGAAGLGTLIAAAASGGGNADNGPQSIDELMDHRESPADDEYDSIWTTHVMIGAGIAIAQLLWVAADPTPLTDKPGALDVLLGRGPIHGHVGIGLYSGLTAPVVSRRLRLRGHDLGALDGDRHWGNSMQAVLRLWPVRLSYTTIMQGSDGPDVHKVKPFEVSTGTRQIGLGLQLFSGGLFQPYVERRWSRQSMVVADEDFASHPYQISGGLLDNTVWVLGNTFDFTFVGSELISGVLMSLAVTIEYAMTGTHSMPEGTWMFMVGTKLSQSSAVAAGAEQRVQIEEGIERFGAWRSERAQRAKVEVQRLEAQGREQDRERRERAAAAEAVAARKRHARELELEREAEEREQARARLEERRRELQAQRRRETLRLQEARAREREAQSSRELQQRVPAASSGRQAALERIRAKQAAAASEAAAAEKERTERRKAALERIRRKQQEARQRAQPGK